MGSMRTILGMGAAAFALMAAPALAVPGDGSPYDFAAGGGQTMGGDQFGFTAHDGPRGATGYVTYRTETLDVGGTVTCINAAAGRLATIGIVIERSSDPALVGQGLLLYVEDRDAVDPAGTDRIAYMFVDSRQTRSCTARRMTPFQLLESGEILVEDSTDIDLREDPAPTP
jgi:hypothetical protein